MNFPSCNASKCRILRCFATHAAICEMYRILSKLSFQRKMRQISASKRSQNVVEITKTDYCGFGQVSSFILPHPSISRHRERPSALSEQWAIIFQNQFLTDGIKFLRKHHLSQYSTKISRRKHKYKKNYQPCRSCQTA